MNTEPRSYRRDGKAGRKSALERVSSALVFFTITGIAITISIPAAELLGSGERIQCEAYTKAPDGISLIAHAGGGLTQGDYSNSQDALDLSARNGFELFELDFIWTSDGQLAIGHDWKGQYRFWNNLSWGDWLGSFYFAPSSSTFEKTTPKFGLIRLSLDTLLEWLHKNEGRIVTDFKTDNIAGLTLIAHEAKDLQHRFVPQIYSMSEYSAVRELGYDDIILTTYRLSPTAEVFRQIDSLDLFAITVPVGAVAKAANIVSNNLIMTHTVNSPVTLPASGYYTDCLVPADGV